MTRPTAITVRVFSSDPEGGGEDFPKDLAGFRALSVDGALDIMEIASPEEKRRFLPSMADKIRNGAARMTVVELKEAVDRYRQVAR